MTGTDLWFLMQNYVAEFVGLVALYYLITFTADYYRFAKWRKYPEGRAVMYLIATVTLTVLLLTLHGFVPKYEGRWIVEIIFYTPVAIAAHNLRRTLRKTLGLPSRWLIKIPKRGVTDEQELDEDTTPPNRSIKS